MGKREEIPENRWRIGMLEQIDFNGRQHGKQILLLSHDRARSVGPIWNQRNCRPLRGPGCEQRRHPHRRN
jgi:hypothetical protein